MKTLLAVVMLAIGLKTYSQEINVDKPGEATVKYTYVCENLNGDILKIKNNVDSNSKTAELFLKLDGVDSQISAAYESFATQIGLQVNYVFQDAKLFVEKKQIYRPAKPCRARFCGSDEMTTSINALLKINNDEIAFTCN